MTTTASRPVQPLQPLRALAALRELIRNPEGTEQVFHIMQALCGGTIHRNLDRLRRLRPDLVARRQEMLPALCDREALAALPDGSLGRTYLAFCQRAGITPESLVAAGAAAGRREDESLESWFERRGRDTHDLWHVVTGYSTEPLGEVCVVAFSFAQTRHLGFGLIALAGAFKLAQVVGWRRSLGLTLSAMRLGRRANWLPGQDWAALLARPLSEVRQRLNIEPQDLGAAGYSRQHPLPA